MNRIWTAISILLVLMIGCITELTYINKITNDMKDRLLEINQYVENNSMETALKSSNELHEEWDKNHSIMALFITHDRLENIDQSVEIINANIKSDESSDFFTESARLYAQLNHLKDTELPTINNIL